MGSITRGLSNNITTGGVILPAGITNASVSAVTSFANASGGTLILLSTQTASASATISFTTGLDSTYDEYIFKLINIHPSLDDATGPDFQVSIDGGSNYGVNITSTFFRSTHDESGSNAELAYQASLDLAQSTNFQNIGQLVGNDNDQSASGYLHLFNPSSTTFVKHFIARMNVYHASDKSRDCFTAGYINTTSAVDAIQFKMSSGNIDDGVIKLYGVKKS
jgi:hypothetical protein